MGIYDREYYRDPFRGSGLFSGDAPVCRLIIGINVAIFLLAWLSRSDTFEAWLVADTQSIVERFQLWRLLTAAFVHGGPFHILWNMLFLWMVGREMESMYGSRDFAIFYCVAAIVSTSVWALIDWFYQGGQGIMLGASGAVMATAVLYATYYPRREVLFFFVIPMPMWMLVGFYLFSDLFFLGEGLRGNAVPAVAYASHLAGGAFGYLYRYFDLRTSRLSSIFQRRPRLRVVRPEPRSRAMSRAVPSRSASASSATSSPGPVAEEQLDAKLDEILAKISTQGRESLTTEEQRILDEASQRARSRRGEKHP